MGENALEFYYKKRQKQTLQPSFIWENKNGAGSNFVFSALAGY
ncbi:MAG: hypothetical protein WCJ54_07815 [Actinomycetota bacterium]